MKKLLFYFILILIFFNYKSTFSFTFSIGLPNTKSSDVKSKYIKRTYNHFKVTPNNNYISKPNDITVTFDDFTNHFEFNRKRILAGLPGSITMDIGEINSGQKETWVLPNIRNLQGFKEINIQQLDSENSEIVDLLDPGTHVLYSSDYQITELYDLNTNDLFFLGYTKTENNEQKVYEYNQTKAPIPLELGINFTSIVIFEDPDNENNYVEYTDIHDVIGQGILKTYDDGDVDALKMIYKEEERTYEDNVLVSLKERYEIIFYSKKGHYVTANITDPWNSEGEVTLQNLTYQKLEEKTASVKDELLVNITVFPNPIQAGSLLTINSEFDLKNHSVSIFNINGQKINTSKFTENSNNQYQITVPEKIASGIYFYKVHDKKGEVLVNGKLQIK